jgi:hypothetical protein
VVGRFVDPVLGVAVFVVMIVQSQAPLHCYPMVRDGLRPPLTATTTAVQECDAVAPTAQGSSTTPTSDGHLAYAGGLKKPLQPRSVTRANHAGQPMPERDLPVVRL